MGVRATIQTANVFGTSTEHFSQNVIFPLIKADNQIVHFTRMSICFSHTSLMHSPDLLRVAKLTLKIIETVSLDWVLCLAVTNGS